MTRPANGRAHLSIGEVLSLLQDEFPDVTISKIRFLESQGLLDPERTPSGYRKFYDVDIRRLRWILRQQKEHYLPLKVIKDRLDRNGGEIPEEDEEQAEAGEPTRSESEPARGRLGVRHLAEEALGASRNGTPVSTVESRPAGGPPDRWRDSPVHDTPLEGETTRRRKPRLLPAPPPPPEPPLSGRSGRIREREMQNGSSAPVPRRQDVPRQAAPRPVTPQDAPPPGAGAVRRVEEPAASAATESGHAAPADVSLTIEDLAEASGLSVRELRDLEKFGLIEPYEGDIYDGDALVVAHTAAGFLQHGIEARHMRAYKVAMEREAALFDQIVLPVMRQRNPEARLRAARTVTELMRLGEVMRSVLLRRALREYLGGGS